MIGSAFLASLAGVGDFWVNWLVGLYVTFRFLFWAVYYSGIVIVIGGARPIVCVLGLLMNLAVVAMALYAIAS